jgi:hypothetical protein
MQIYYQDDLILLNDKHIELIENLINGNKKNAIAMARTRGYSSGRYLLERLLPPVDTMKLRYHALNRHPWLLPWFWLCRAVRLIFNGKAQGIRSEYRINRDFSQDDLNNTDCLLSGLGLKG